MTPHEPLEERMLAQYVKEKLRGKRTWVHLRLGMPPGIRIGDPNWQWERRIKMPRLPEVDLVYEEGGIFYLVEFKISRFQAAAGQLLQYKQLLPQTPGFIGLTDEEIWPKIVFGRRDPMAEQFVRSLGIEVEHYEPNWLREAILARPWLR